MDKEKLKQANEKLQVIENLKTMFERAVRVSKKVANDCAGYHYYSWAGHQIEIPRELKLPMVAMLESYYRTELEKAKKEFEEM